MRRNRNSNFSRVSFSSIILDMRIFIALSLVILLITPCRAAQDTEAAKDNAICFPEGMSEEECKTIDTSYEKTLCLEGFFKDMVLEKSAIATIDLAREMQAAGEIDDCHLVAHMAGHANLHKHDYDLGKALATCPLDCIQGCIHGAVQTYVAERVDIENIEEELSGICNDIQRDTQLYRQCIHGIGHGFLTNNYMPVEQAIKACRKLGGEDSHTCLGGLFMENMQPNLLLPENQFAASIPRACDAVDDSGDQTLIFLCYEAVGEAAMFYTAHNLFRSLEYCATSLDNPEYVTICKDGAREQSRTVLKNEETSHH